MLEFEHISVRFAAGHSVQAVENISLTIPDGSRIAIVGETGSGKSVLLLAVLRLLPENAVVSGSAKLDGEEIFEMSPKRLNAIRGGVISYVPQGGGGSLNPLYSIGFQVGEPLMEHRGYKRKQAFAASIPLLKRFHIGDEERRASEYPHTFSGGMRQRAMIAMGISANARILFLDEPTKGLDGKRIRMVEEALELLKKETILCVTHDLHFAVRACHFVCVMYAAQQVEYGSAKEIWEHPLHPYTQAMLDALPENGMNYQAGFAPEHDTEQGDQGCRYRYRCPYRETRCDRMPPLFKVGERKVRCFRYAAEDGEADQNLSEKGA